MEQQEKASSSLVEAWQRNPEEWVAAIVHTRGAPSTQVQAAEKLGLLVTRTFRLTHTMAIRGSARSVLSLLGQDWVEKVELDQTIRTKGDPLPES